MSAHPFPPSVTVADRPSDAARLRSALDRHYDFVWRTLRYLGVPDGDADDSAQQVFCVLARRIGDVVPGTEMAFLFKSAVDLKKDAANLKERHICILSGNVVVQRVQMWLAPVLHGAHCQQPDPTIPVRPSCRAPFTALPRGVVARQGART